MKLMRKMSNITIDINVPDKGLFVMGDDSSIGKTYLAELLQALEDDRIAVVTFNRDKAVQKALIERISDPMVKMVLMDRLDLYINKELTEFISKTSKDKVILIDIKNLLELNTQIDGAVVLLLTEEVLKVF